MPLTQYAESIEPTLSQIFLLLFFCYHNLIHYIIIIHLEI